MKCANDNNYSVIRIIQDDVYNDKYNQLQEIDNNIQVNNIFMCKNNKYEIFN